MLFCTRVFALLLLGTVLTVEIGVYAAPYNSPSSRSVQALNVSSNILPTSNLPFSPAIYSQAAGCCQQTYCVSDPTVLTVGDATILSTYGDGIITPRTNIYHSTSLGIVLAYQGTNSTSIISDLYDVDFLQTFPDSRLGLPFDAFVDMVFKNAWLGSYKNVLSGLEKAKQAYPGSKLTVVGHSLGASQALLASLALEKLYGVDMVITFGLPRTGNPIFANAVDNILGKKFSYVVNGDDIVPLLPPRFFGYQHPSGQVWINPASSTNWAFYPGQENTQGADSVLFPPLSVKAHEGTYFHTQIGASGGHCPATVGQD